MLCNMHMSQNRRNALSKASPYFVHKSFLTELATASEGGAPNAVRKRVCLEVASLQAKTLSFDCS